MAKPGDLGDEMVADGPSELLDDGSRALLVGVGGGVALYGPSVGLAVHVCDAKVVRDLGDDEDGHVASVVERPHEVLGRVIANDLAKGVPGDLVANLSGDEVLGSG